MYSIQIANVQDQVEIDESLLKQVAEKTLTAEQVAAAQISIAVVDNARIRVLNRRHLDHDYDTDVLSFLLESEESAPPENGSAVDPSEETPRGRGKRIGGEVVISAEMAAATADDFDWSPHDEIVLYLVHGLLHLVGYDDCSDAQRRKMRFQERSLLSAWGLVPRYADETAGDES